MKKEELDFVLVPIGLAAMAGYHLWLLRRVLRRPTTTVIGINSINRRIWVQTMMEDPSKNGVLAVQTLRNNIMASTLLASTAIMLSSLIAVLMTSHSGGGGGEQEFVFGNTSGLVRSIKYYSHASILINVPVRARRHRGTAAEYVARAVNRGSYFWSLGLRAFYFSFPLFLWVFGPIPMVGCCLFLVVTLYYLDVYKEWELGVGGEEEKGGEQC
ncbi:hypothetical protein ACMD2_08144 [Ananas comosus]|uniref:DUF599 domain-containing protein n=1 Tax=Ananas comosus TaxID=4615 RepID=A0A199V2V8_ANACO|nr:hypothetical protein ACMD2_08144 [Ananas comosus]